MRTRVSVLSAVATLLTAWPLLAQPEPPPDPETPETPEEAPEPPPEPPPEPVPPPLPEPGPDAPVDAWQPPKLPPGHPPVAPAPVTEGLPPPPLAPPAIFPSQLEGETDQESLAGIHGGRVFIRDAHDNFRLYPGVRLRTDFYAAPGSDLTLPQGGHNLHPQVAIRRLRLEMSGEIIERLAFTAGIELGGRRIGEGANAFATDGRFAMATSHDGEVRPAEATVSYRLRDWLSFTLGLQNVPFSMENRTREYALTFMERNMAIRGFAVPYDKELGLTAWGELFGERTLNYEIGVFTGDGPMRPAVDARPDFAGRIFARPLTGAGDALFFKLAQVGVSARHGERDQNYVDYDYPSVATNQGWVLWQPGYVDSLDRRTRIIPSGAQNSIGGELRLPFELPTGAVIELRGEAYYVANNTREAVVGFEQTNTERFGRMKGVGWYAEINWWACCTDQLVNGEPGMWRPVHADLDRDEPIKKGLEVSALVAGIAANYDGATRLDSPRDPNTPSANLAAYQFGGAVQYWFNWNFRAAFNYMAYFAPDSGDPTKNQVVVPDNLPTDAGPGDGNVHHEIGTRVAVTF